jgi:hypothetical protein
MDPFLGPARCQRGVLPRGKTHHSGARRPHGLIQLVELEDTVSELHAVDTERAVGLRLQESSELAPGCCASSTRCGFDRLAALGLQVSDVDNGVHL